MWPLHFMLAIDNLDGRHTETHIDTDNRHVFGLKIANHVQNILRSWHNFTNHMLSRTSYNWPLENAIIQYVEHIQAKRSGKYCRFLTIQYVKYL